VLYFIVAAPKLSAAERRRPPFTSGAPGLAANASDMAR